MWKDNKANYQSSWTMLNFSSITECLLQNNLLTLRKKLLICLNVIIIYSDYLV